MTDEVDRRHVKYRKQQIYYRKPKKTEFIRVNPDPNYTKICPTVKYNNETYLITDNDALKELETIVGVDRTHIRVAINENNHTFLVGTSFPYKTSHKNPWSTSLQHCLNIAEKEWVRLLPDREAQGYQLVRSDNTEREPQFPKTEFNTMIEQAFEDKTITTKDHFIIKYLNGDLSHQDVETKITDTTEVYSDEPWTPDQRAIDILGKVSELDQRYNDNVFDYFAKVFTMFHSGDRATIETLLVSWALQACINTEGIQPTISSEMGKGKTSGIHAALHMHPQEYVNIGTVSPKVIFYMGNAMRPGSVIFLDDIELSNDLNDVMKRSMSSFQKEAIHITLAKDSEGNFSPKKLHSPPRLLWITTNTKVDVGDDQLRDRQYIIPTDTDPNAEKNFDMFIATKNSEGREDYPEIDEVKICRDIIKLIKTNLFKVKVNSFKLEFEDNMSRRLKIQFYDFIKAITIIRHKNRKQEVIENSVILLDSTYEDAVYAKMLFDKNIDLQRNKMSRSEIDLWNHLPLDIDGVEEKDIIESYATTTNKTHTASRAKVRRDLFGRNGRGGLINKTDAVWVEKQWRYVEQTGAKRELNVIFCREHPTTNDPFTSFVKIIPCGETSQPFFLPDPHDPS